MRSILSLAALVSAASAHTIFQELWVNGVSQGHLNGIRTPSYNGPIEDVTIAAMSCNGGPNPLVNFSPNVIPVTAGATVTAEWHHGLNGRDPADTNDPVDPSHKGPIIAYLAKVDSALQSSTAGLKWFKIWQEGLGADGKWAVDRMIVNQGKVSFPIPKCVANGEYLLRVEIIALHGAGSYPGAQFYMECAQLKISGGGSASPATVSFPGAYSPTDPGVKFNLYYPVPTSYTIPGPTVFTCDGSTAPPPVTSPTTPPQTSSAASPPKTSTVAAPPPTTTNQAPQWAQCGGLSWTGPTTCVPPYKCGRINEHYSQCT